MAKRKLSKKARRKKFIIKLFFALLIIVAILIGIFVFTRKDIEFLKNIDYKNSGDITYYDIYGIHMNFNGVFELSDDFSNPKLVLANGNKENVIDWKLDNDGNSYSFETSNYINDGINLESLDTGTYYLLIKAETKENDETVYKYFPLTNATEYDDLTYYTLTENNSNKKIDITWDRFENNELLGFNIKNTKLPDDVYDITIDPGHDSNDAGMIVCANGEVPNNSGECANSKAYKESDINFTVSEA